MSDPLDPMDALVGGVTDAVKRLLAFFVVTAGAAILGVNLHQAPTFLGSIGTLGLSAILNVLNQFDSMAPILWALMMLHSLVIWYLIPLVLLYLWLLIRLWRGADLFSILLVLVLVHPLHTFLYMVRADPITGIDLGIAIGLLIMAEISLAALILWWRHISENAPPPPAEPEPEL